MVPDLEKPRVTEIQVRMDCNGCVHKIKKALNSINGIHDIYIDIPQQKLTIIGCVDPEKIVKAIKKTRKTATICSHTTPEESEPPPEGGGSGGGGGGDVQSPDPTNPPPGEVPPAEQTPLTEEPLTPPENSPPAAEGQSTDSAACQPPGSSGTREVEEVHVVYRYPSSDHRVYSGLVDRYPGSQGGLGFGHEPPPPIHVNHSYNTYKPMPFVTGYEHIRPHPQYAPYSTPEPPLPPQAARYSRPEPPPCRNQPEPPPQRDTRPEPPQQHHSWPEPPQCHSWPEPPQHHSRPEPRQQYSPEPQHYSHHEPPQQYTQDWPEPPQQYAHYSHSPPPPQYSYYSHQEPSPQYAQYSRHMPPDYSHYSGDYHSSNRNGNITSIFSDEDPNGCKIV